MLSDEQSNSGILNTFIQIKLQIASGNTEQKQVRVHTAVTNDSKILAICYSKNLSITNAICPA